MKIRSGFVSNSSSSSFIIRGMKISVEEAIKIFGIQEEVDNLDTDDEYEIFEFVSSKFDGFNVEPDGNYFGSQDYTSLIVGEDAGSLEDGEVTELKEYTPEEDQVILEKFEKLGFDVWGMGKLRTFVQMVSNDNY